MNANLKAFLSTITLSELGAELISESDKGYNVIVGSAPTHLILMTTYKDHPRRPVEVQPGLISTAAGAYQILARYFDAYRHTLNLPDFGPTSQDVIAIQMIREQGAYLDVIEGNFTSAVTKCNNIWASLPGANYKQHENKMSDLQAAFVSAGGTLAQEPTCA